MKQLDNTLDQHFIHSLYLKLKNSNDLVETKTLVKEFDVYKKESKNL